MIKLLIFPFDKRPSNCTQQSSSISTWLSRACSAIMCWRVPGGGPSRMNEDMSFAPPGDLDEKNFLMRLRSFELLPIWFEKVFDTLLYTEWRGTPGCWWYPWLGRVPPRIWSAGGCPRK